MNMMRQVCLRTFVICAAATIGSSAFAQAADTAGEAVEIIGPHAGRATPAPPVPLPREPMPDLSSSGRVPGVVPIGTVVAWLKSFTNAPALPENWVECNGQVLALTNSPFNGLVIPDLNGAGGGDKRFLRGSTASGAQGGAETHDHGNLLVQRFGGNRVNVSEYKRASNLPPYYEVTWIMRVR